MKANVKARKSFLTAGIVAACATLFGIGETLQYYLRSRLWGYPFTWTGSLSENVLTSFVLAALTPVAFFMSRRFRLGRRVMRQRLPLHALGGLAFAIGAVFAIAALAVVRKPVLQFEPTAWKLGTFYLLFYFAIYWAIVGAIHAAYYYGEAQAREERLVRERLEVLRSKLNPHFLFNTLNAISTMALQRDHERVTQSLGLLGDMLRATLDDSLPQEIPLARELDLTDKYLALQRIRFADRLRVERQIDPRSLDALVPSMLLQPLIENAIVHGVGAKPGDGWVKIETRPVDGQLVLTVSDSGNGFAPPRAGDKSDGNGIGLANTRERLATLYGGAQRLALQSLPGAGAQVTIEIPLRRGA
ncbi:MAG TPA: histidine kinase [Thermoanaerobaculia bacterium]|nr:histidine kinase [Thermoanaerobaculia bacterium]